MTILNTAYIRSLLADSCYVKELTGKSGNLLKNALTDHMTHPLAEFISNNFTAVNEASGYDSSFEATVWQGNAGTPAPVRSIPDFSSPRNSTHLLWKVFFCASPVTQFQRGVF